MKVGMLFPQRLDGPGGRVHVGSQPVGRQASRPIEERAIDLLLAARGRHPGGG